MGEPTTACFVQAMVGNVRPTWLCSQIAKVNMAFLMKNNIPLC